MKENLQILHLEDVDLDAEIIKNILFEEGIKCTLTRATCKKEYLSTIHQSEYDVILADNSLPDYNGISALKYANELKPKIPFIFVSGTIGEERAVEALRYGAKDYVHKHHLNKLAPAIQRVMQEVELERELKESETKYRSFFENSIDALLFASAEGKIFSANLAACTMLGYTEEELIKLDRNDIVDITNPQLSIFLSKRALNGKAHGELTMVRKDGRRFPVELSSAIFKDSKDLEHASMIIRDITERKRSENELRKLSRAVDQSSVSIIITNLKGEIEYANPKALEITGYKLNELIGKNSRIFSSGDKSKSEYKFLWETITSGKEWQGEFHNKKKSGEFFWESAAISPIVNEEGKIEHYLAIKEDITERKKLETDLSSAAELAKLGYWEYDVYSDHFTFNDQYYRLIHGSSTEKQGGNTMGAEEFSKRLVHSEDASMLANALLDAISSPNPEFLGKEELRVLRDDGEVANVSVQFKVLKDSSGRTYIVYGVNQDITEQKHDEKELIEAKERAEQSDKLKTEFLAQMSHEIRTPLNAIIGNADFLEEMLADNMDADTQESFKGINLASKRIIRTVDLILNFSELRASGYVPIFAKIDLKVEIIDKLIKEYLRSAKQKGIEFTATSAENNANIFADKYSINQIFANLIDNAVKYTEKGKVEINIDRNEKGNIIVEVKDTGVGINKYFLPKLFEPFIQEEQGYSRTYDGNGLGLALVKKYCEINNALIEVESEKNVGSTFRVTFDKNFKESES